MQPRIALVTIGQAPRPDLTPELLRLLDLSPGGVATAEFGALDQLDRADLPPPPREGRLQTQLRDGPALVGASWIAKRLAALLANVDAAGFDLAVLMSTGIYLRPCLRTPFVHGQFAVDAWIEPLVMSQCELGLVYPLPDQHRGFAHGTLVQNARTVVATGDAATLEAAAQRLKAADLILLHSVGYSEAMAERMAEQTRRPVITARRIIAAAVRLQLASRERHLAGTLEREASLTARERDVMAALLDGANNKEVGRRLGISHRTVEIHRARALAKLDASSPLELARRGAMLRRP